MQAYDIRLCLVSLALSAVAVPALASNYIEADLRSTARVSELSRTEVDAEARFWTRLIAPNGYIGSSRQAAVQVNMKSRAQVGADTANWIRSGLATIEHGQVGVDRDSPAYKQAAQAYFKHQDGNVRQAAVQAFGTSDTFAR
jgi:hypothetical protein